MKVARARMPVTSTQAESCRRLLPLKPRLGVSVLSVMKQLKKKAGKQRDSLDILYDKRDRALERVVALWEKDQDVDDAVDALTIAHIAAVRTIRRMSNKKLRPQPRHLTQRLRSVPGLHNPVLSRCHGSTLSHIN